ncbi:hypothetical protein QA601_02245 [Chitinispirillales bacterium ANBcel5]|uniref:hypothetical protein n=1 Tax=Cellulosispirillum alkaliphilum TaxID=3039283 RepID=UPI002A526D45|nr:hypothetical protein [Chitinispirillales bacterium ANBcel5]
MFHLTISDDFANQSDTYFWVQMLSADPSGADFRVFHGPVNIAASPGTVTDGK